MGPVTAGLILQGAGVAGDFLGGVLGSNSAKDQLRQQQHFYAEMRRTQYQATMKDLEAAGLNPMMLYSGSGLSQGANIGGPDQGAKMQEGISGASAKATNAALMAAQISQVANAAELTKEQAEGQKIQNTIARETFLGENFTGAVDIPSIPLALPAGAKQLASFNPQAKGRRNRDLQMLDIATKQRTVRNIEAMTGKAVTEQDLNRTMNALEQVRVLAGKYGLSQQKIDAEFWDQFGKWANRIEKAGGIAGILVKVMQGVIQVAKGYKEINP